MRYGTVGAHLARRGITEDDKRELSFTGGRMEEVDEFYYLGMC